MNNGEEVTVPHVPVRLILLIVAAVLVAVALIYTGILPWPVFAFGLRIVANVGLIILDWFVIQPLLVLPRLMVAVFGIWFVGSWTTRGLYPTLRRLRDMVYDPSDAQKSSAETLQGRIVEAVSRPIENVKRGVYKTIRRWAIVVGVLYAILYFGRWFL